MQIPSTFSSTQSQRSEIPKTNLMAVFRVGDRYIMWTDYLTSK